MDKIQGPGLFGYDRQHIQVVRSDTPQSVKPNVFREVDDSVAMALLLTDVVSLSEEARELLNLLRKKMGGRDDAELARTLKEELGKKLIYTYKEVRDLVYGRKDEEAEKKSSGASEGQALHRFVIPLSSGEKKEERERIVIRNGRIRELLEKMIVFSPGEKVKLLLMRELEAMGEKMISDCKSFGVRLIVLPRGQSLPELRIKGLSIVGKGEKTFDGRSWDQVRGIYCQDRRIIVLGEELIGHPQRVTSRHEFAHAFDHAFSSRNQRRLPLSVQLWNLFVKNRAGLVSDYASTNPAEYFAESVEAFFREKSREALRQKDPEMHQYLETLFAA